MMIAILADQQERVGNVPFDPQRLRDLRIEQGYTERMMADLLGMKYQNYQFYEKPKKKGGYAPKGARMAQIARILLVSPEYLRGETDDPAPKDVTLTEDEVEVVRAWRDRDIKRLNELFVQKARKDMGK